MRILFQISNSVVKRAVLAVKSLSMANVHAPLLIAPLPALLPLLGVAEIDYELRSIRWIPVRVRCPCRFASWALNVQIPNWSPALLSARWGQSVHDLAATDAAGRADVAHREAVRDGRCTAPNGHGQVLIRQEVAALVWRGRAGMSYIQLSSSSTCMRLIAKGACKVLRVRWLHARGAGPASDRKHILGADLRCPRRQPDEHGRSMSRPITYAARRTPSC